VNVDSEIDLQFPQHAFVNFQSRSARNIHDVQVRSSLCTLINRRTHLPKDFISLGHGLCYGVTQLGHVEILPSLENPCWGLTRFSYRFSRKE
jgi:hypothetical protein